MDALPCIVCHKPLKNVWEGKEGKLVNQPSDGTEFTTRGHYGSRAFDPMDGTHLCINICDECLVDAGKKGLVHCGRQTITETITLKPWEPRDL